MNTKSLFKMVIVGLFAGALLLSCERGKGELYEDHSLSACGVDSPLINLPWLKELCQNSLKEDQMSIYLVQDTISLEYYFKTNRSFLFNEEPFVEGYYYNCLGESVFFYTTVTLPTPEYIDFRSTKKTLGVIWRIKNKDIWQ